MKRIFCMILILMSLPSIVFADQQEWFDKNYDFPKIKRIVVNFTISEQLKNGVIEHEATEIFQNHFSNKLVPKFSKQNIKIIMFEDVLQEIKNHHKIDIFSMYETDAEKARAFIADYIPNNFDTVLSITLQQYNMGTQYVDGYSYSVPTTQTYYNGTNIVTVTGSQQHYVSGGNRPTAYALVKYELIDIPTTKNIWTRIDNRSRVNKDALEHSKPKDLYQRSLKSFFSDMASKLITKSDKD